MRNNLFYWCVKTSRGQHTTCDQCEFRCASLVCLPFVVMVEISELTHSSGDSSKIVIRNDMQIEHSAGGGGGSCCGSLFTIGKKFMFLYGIVDFATDFSYMVNLYQDNDPVWASVALVSILLGTVELFHKFAEYTDWGCLEVFRRASARFHETMEDGEGVEKLWALQAWLFVMRAGEDIPMATVRIVSYSGQVTGFWNVLGTVTTALSMFGLALLLFLLSLRAIFFFLGKICAEDDGCNRFWMMLFGFLSVAWGLCCSVFSFLFGLGVFYMTSDSTMQIYLASVQSYDDTYTVSFAFYLLFALQMVTYFIDFVYWFQIEVFCCFDEIYN
jgi:hypothetical protein